MNGQSKSIPSDYTDVGYLKVNTTTGRGTIPLVNSTVTISSMIDGEQILYKVVSTNKDGQSGKIELPAPPRSLSLKPGSSKPPYATYVVEVDKENYKPMAVTHVEVFPGVVSVLPCDLQPAEQAFSSQETIILNTSASPIL